MIKSDEKDSDLEEYDKKVKSSLLGLSEEGGQAGESDKFIDNNPEGSAMLAFSAYQVQTSEDQFKE